MWKLWWNLTYQQISENDLENLKCKEYKTILYVTLNTGEDFKFFLNNE